MKLFFSIITLWLLNVAQFADCYDAEVEVKRRTEHLEKMCQKYSDPKRPESEVCKKNFKVEQIKKFQSSGFGERRN